MDSGQPESGDAKAFDVLIVGAGFAGLYMLHRTRQLGLSARVLEAGADVGGTWYWNRYPGARCDIESIEYSYQFSDELQQEWDWTERYASQPEILAYIHHVAERFDLRRDVQLETRIVEAVFDESRARWELQSEAGERFEAPFCVMATGCLSQRNMPDWKGLESFRGEAFHTGDWPEEGADLRGKRVGVIGTGSSAIQSIPLIAEEALHLTVFQRTAGYTIPARNHPLDPETLDEIKAGYPAFRQAQSESFFGTLAGFVSAGPSAKAATPEEAERAFEAAWERGGSPPFLNTYDDLMRDPASNDVAVGFVTGKIRKIVEDPAVAEKLIPTQTFGCKRLCLDSGYYETFNRPNVELVDVSANPIDALVPEGLRLADGTCFALDAIVFATGFDAMTGALLAIDPRGRGGVRLSEHWAEGPRTYLGLGVHGFPNLFVVTGPGSPSVLANMVPAIEQHVDWITDCLAYLREQGFTHIEADRDAQDAWVEHVNAVAGETLFPSCASWYLGANIEGKPRVFMPYIGYAPYVEKCDEVVAKGYEGFTLSR